ncbi:hypothetical protein AYI69_g1236 [Smittium culicis]|uniref:Small ribosomal subunit protein mS38 n=1 Tax=Smittium culicis TaxID=133412 RepID=A0A1R1XBH4_9FUNG|nr:hypothetical protein AYI69_g9620 [Smittium culicis]OMJ29271.1 hypothetical protein AYI69_g1236 [Smittium culicis]
MLLSLGAPKFASKLAPRASQLIPPNFKPLIASALPKFASGTRNFSESESKNKKFSTKKVPKAALDQTSVVENINSPKENKQLYNLNIEKPQWALASFFAMDKPLFGLENYREAQIKKTSDSSFQTPYLSSTGIPREAVIPELIRLGPFAESIFGSYESEVSAKNLEKNEQEDIDDLVHDYLDAVEFSLNNSEFRSIRSARMMARLSQPLTRYEKFLQNKENVASLHQDITKFNTNTSSTEALQLSSVLQKKKKKMNKHKYKKLRKRTKAIRKRLGK